MMIWEYFRKIIYQCYTHATGTSKEKCTIRRKRELYKSELSTAPESRYILLWSTSKPTFCSQQKRFHDSPDCAAVALVVHVLLGIIHLTKHSTLLFHPCCHKLQDFTFIGIGITSCLPLIS